MVAGAKEGVTVRWADMFSMSAGLTNPLLISTFKLYPGFEHKAVIPTGLKKKEQKKKRKKR